MKYTEPTTPLFTWTLSSILSDCSLGVLFWNLCTVYYYDENSHISWLGGPFFTNFTVDAIWPVRSIGLDFEPFWTTLIFDPDRLQLGWIFFLGLKLMYCLLLLRKIAMGPVGPLWYKFEYISLTGRKIPNFWLKLNVKAQKRSLWQNWLKIRKKNLDKSWPSADKALSF